MTFGRSKQLALSRLAALLCLLVLLVAYFAAPIHRHDSSQEGTCLLCHATERANVVPIANDVGKPIPAASKLFAASLKPLVIAEVPDATRTPRAPPSTLL